MTKPGETASIAFSDGREGEAASIPCEIWTTELSLCGPRYLGVISGGGKEETHLSVCLREICDSSIVRQLNCINF